MRRALIVAIVSALPGCGEVAVPFTVSMDLAVDGPADIPEGADTGQIEDRTAEWGTGITDLEAARGDLPATAQLDRIDAVELTIGSPARGPIGTWVERCSLYASVDDTLSDDDLTIGAFSYLGDTQDEVSIGLNDDVDVLFAGDTVALFVQATLREAPTEPLSFPISIDGIGYIRPF